MMFSKFDEDAQKVLLMAKKEMLDLCHPYVGSEHLLLAILHNKNLQVTKMLNEYDITYESYKNEIIKIIGVGKTNNTWFLYTPLLKRVIENAILDSKDEGNKVTVERIFISLLEEGDGVANRVLLGMNIDVDFLYDKFVDKFIYIKNVSGKKLLVEEYAVDFNDKCKTVGFDPVIGREDKVERIIEILLRRTKNNPLLIGDAGVGKTAIIEELARKIVNGEVPKKLATCRILSISMASLIAGTKYRGEFEERISKIISDLESNPDIILFIDEIHTLIGAGGAEGAIDASNILKPYLARGKIKIIGATTKDEYSKYLENDNALDRRFQKIFIEEATLSEVKNILLNLRGIYEDFHGVKISDKIIDLIVELSDRYIPCGKQPDKAIDLLDESCSKASVIENFYDKKIRLLTNDINNIKFIKNAAIMEHDYTKASEMKEKQEMLENKLNKLTNSSISTSISKNVTNEIIYDVIYSKTKIPVKQILNLDKKKIYSTLSKIVIGQQNVIDGIIKFLLEDNFVCKNVPKSLLLVGNSGVGKTYFVKEYARLLFSSESFIKIDMSEYRESHSVSKIIGSPPGYVGYSDNKYVLTKIKQNPYSVLLLDEIEKAHSSVLKLFLQVFDDGYMTTSTGEIVDFRNVTIFMTSNLGTNENYIGFKGTNELVIKNKIKEFLGVELTNRIGHIAYFNEIDSVTIKKIIKKRFNELEKEFNEKIEISTDIVERIKEKSEYKLFGARRINRVIDSEIKGLLDVK